MQAKLILQDGTTLSGESFGYEQSSAGEVVFNTGMVGYPECFTDPSYYGQILVLTYPLIGNYGVPKEENSSYYKTLFESPKIHLSGLVVTQYSEEYSHWEAKKSLSQWLKDEQVPAITGLDTRFLAKKIREEGTLLGKIIINGKDTDFYDPDRENLVSKVSSQEVTEYGDGEKTVAILDCGCKHGIIRSITKRGFRVRVYPWDYDISQENFAGLLISNGPGNPKFATAAIQSVKQVLQRTPTCPVFGICFGNQILALAAGADIYKLKYGHRSQNQPCVVVGSKRCFITSQNHGFAVDEKTLPPDWEPWFFNANDGTNEGIKHIKKPFRSVQFHPEAFPGPVDTEFLFDEFLEML